MGKSNLLTAIALQICLTFSTADNNMETASADQLGIREVTENVFLEDYMLLPFWASPLLNGTQCHDDMKYVLQKSKELDVWALQMLDASAKLPSGILNGNLNQYGDFDECLSTRGRYNNNFIRGKYCLANIDVKASELNNDRIQFLDDLLHSYRLITNQLSDQGHRIAKTETFLWGLCVPSSCNHNQVEIIVKSHLKEFAKRKSLQFDVVVDEQLCYTDEENIFSLIKLLVACLFSSILLMGVLEFFVDLKRIETKSPRLSTFLKCFSIRRNWNILMRINAPEDDIKCLHGLRFLKAIALLLSHKQMAMLFTPTVNRTAMGEAFSRTWTMLGRSAILYTDSFIMFSGVLVSYSFVKSLDNKKTMDFKDKLISRIIRFTPNLLGLILFCTYLMDDLGTGPQWGLVVTKYANICKKNMWKNLLYIHNYFGFENMCLTHTHQIGIDMQLFLISPIFVYTLWKSPKVGSFLLAAFSCLSTWLRYEVTMKEKLSTLIYYGIPVDQLWRTANLSYIIPTHRLTVYLMGIGFGYCLRKGGKNLQFSRLTATIVWLLALSSGLYAMFGPYKAAFKGYVYDPLESARFNAFAPVLWIFSMTWILILCVNGYGGFLNDFLSWKYFQIFTRISYSLYLAQFPVFFYGVGTQRTVEYFKGFQSLFDIPELCIIFIASILITILLEIPFQEMKKHFMIKPPMAKRKEKVEEISNESKIVHNMRRLKIYGI